MFVLLLLAGYSSSVALTSATYSDEQSCRAAGEAAKAGLTYLKAMGGAPLPNIRYVCTPASSK